MGFKAPKSRLTLKFAASEFEGFVVVMRRMTFDDALTFDEGRLRELRQQVNNGTAEQSVIDEHMAAMHAGLVAAIQEWNLEDDENNPVPVSVATLRAQETDFFWTLVHAWIMAMSLKVDDDTKAPSSDGKPSEELSIPMEPLSGSRAS